MNCSTSESLLNTAFGREQQLTNKLFKNVAVCGILKRDTQTHKE